MNNIRLGKKTIAGVTGVLMITTALTLIFASGAIADQRGTLTDMTVDPATSYIGESENYNFTFVTEQRIIGTGGTENINIVQSDFDFGDITVGDVAVVYWSEAIDQYREMDPASVDNDEGYLNIELGLDGDNIAKDTELKVYLDEGDNEVQNPTAPSTYTFDITTYDSYNQEDPENIDNYLDTPKALDTGSVDVEILYQTEVTADSVMAENADTTEWFGSIKEALTNFGANLSVGDNIIVFDNYTGEPDEGALSLPIDVNENNLTIRAAEGATPTVDATGSGGVAFNIVSENVTIEGLEVIGDENQNVITADSGGDLTVKESLIRVNSIGTYVFGIESYRPITVEDTTFLGGGDDQTMAVTTQEAPNGSTINNNVFKNLRTGIQTRGDDDVTISNNEFENIRASAFYATTAVNDAAGEYLIENNNLTDIGEGIDFNANTDNFTANVIVRNNNFENADATDGWSAVQARQFTTDDTFIVAENNWWNDPAGPLANTDGTRGDNVNLGEFGTVTPWLDAPFPDGEEVSSIEFDQDVYSGMEKVSVTARYGENLGNGPLIVEVESVENQKSITLPLGETDTTGVFENSFRLTDNIDRHGGENLYVENMDTIEITNALDNEWLENASAAVDMGAPVVDNIIVSKVDDSWLEKRENKIWARGEIEFTANFTENNPENMVFTIGEREIVRSLSAGDNSVTVSEYVSRIPDGTLPVTATLTDSGGLSDTLEKDIIVDTTVPDVTVVKPESVGFGPNVDNTEIPIRVDASDNVVDNIAGSGVETVTVDIPALENDISLAYDSESGYWENSITASVEDIDNFEITAAATDRMDLSSDTTATVAVLWDNTAPAIENAWVVYPEGFNAAKVGDTVIVKATVTDDVGVGSVWLNAENVGLDDEIEMTLVDGDVYSAELEDIDVAEENLGLRQLTVTALDTANNEATGIVDVNVVGYYESYEITLEKGWNLISLPIIPENTATEAVLSGFGDAVDNVVSVWGYDALDGQWMTYTPGVPTPPTFPSLRVMEDGKAYWVKMEETATLEIEGREMPVGGGGVIPPTYVLRTGWNLVGFTGVTQKTRDAYLGMVEEQVTGMTVFGYDTDKGLYTVRPSTMLTPGQGYWVFVTEKAAFTAW